MPTFIGRAKKYNFTIEDKKALAKGPPPSVSEPLSWFSYTDKDQDGAISPSDVASTLFLQLDPKPKSSQERITIHNTIQKAWSKFDPNHDMQITKNEFLQCGMIEFIISYQRKWNREYKRIITMIKTKKNRCSGRPPPLSEARKWFEYVDKSDDGFLSADEVVHGLMLSLKPSTSEEMVTIRDIVEHSFLAFDDNGNGSIDKWEFLVKDGMSEALIRIEDQWKIMNTDERTIEKFLKSISAPLRYSDIFPPPLSDAAEWFDHYNIDKTNALSLKEVAHGLFVTYNAISLDRQKVIRELLSSTWRKFDKDNSKSITKDEFLGSKGMAELYDSFFKKIWQDNPPSNNHLAKYDEDNTIDVAIYIPKGQSAGDLVKIPSPRTRKYVLLIIPEINKWKKGASGAYFVVKF